MSATMIPTEPLFIPDGSMEDLMFKTLSNLPDEYYVFHSFRMVEIKDDILEEHETDFIVFHPRFGILCIEAKAGDVYFDGEWKYQYGNKMHKQGPFNQAANNKWTLLHMAQNNYKIRPLLNKCKFSFCVWFPSVSKESLLSKTFPPDAPKELVLTADDLDSAKSLKESIERIFSYKIKDSNIETNLTNEEAKSIINNFLCPKMNIISTGKFELESKKYKFLQLLKEQYLILNFLDEADSVAINGAAGTGKTLIAVEKARRLAEKGEKVLFLCINKELQNYLSQKYDYPLVSYKTLSAYTKEITNSFDNYTGLLNYLIDIYGDKDRLDYNHVIVDEGQDFGIYNEDEDGFVQSKNTIKQEIIRTLRDNLIDNEFGSFYIFYDEMQLIQSNDIPEVIKTADCKLTLYKNCRNTKNIAIASSKTFTTVDVKKNKRKIKVLENALPGDLSRLHFVENNNTLIKQIDDTISYFKAKQLREDEIVILTCKTINSSILTKLGVIENQYYHSTKHRNIKFSTCRKFKGLEAEAVILVDVSESCFNDDIGTKIYYVGASRAKLYLDIMTDLSEQQCLNILSNTFGVSATLQNVRSKFTKTIGCIQYHD